MENGFTEEDTFYKEYITMPNNNSEVSTRAIVASIVGSTKKEASNRAKTTYSIVSSAVMNRVDVQTVASGSGVTRKSTNTTYPNARTGVITTTTNYSGASTYLTFKGTTQLTTTQGVASTGFSATAGGVTLGY